MLYKVCAMHCSDKSMLPGCGVQHYTQNTETQKPSKGVHTCLLCQIRAAICSCIKHMHEKWEHQSHPPHPEACASHLVDGIEHYISIFFCWLGMFPQTPSCVCVAICSHVMQRQVSVLNRRHTTHVTLGSTCKMYNASWLIICLWTCQGSIYV